MNKRKFIKSLTLLGLGGIPSLSAMDKLVGEISHLPNHEVATDEEFGIRSEVAID